MIMAERRADGSAIAKNPLYNVRAVIRIFRLLCCETTKGGMGKHEILFPLRFYPGNDFLNYSQFFFGTYTDQGDSLVNTVTR